MNISLRRAGVAVLAAVSLAAPVSFLAVGSAEAASYRYSNCAALNKDFTHGVGKSNAKGKVGGSTKPVTNFKKSTTIYNKVIKQNRGLDRDKDGVACEKH